MSSVSPVFIGLLASVRTRTQSLFPSSRMTYGHEFGCNFSTSKTTAEFSFLWL